MLPDLFTILFPFRFSFRRTEGPTPRQRLVPRQLVQTRAACAGPDLNFPPTNFVVDVFSWTSLLFVVSFPPPQPVGAGEGVLLKIFCPLASGPCETLLFLVEGDQPSFGTGRWCRAADFFHIFGIPPSSEAGQRFPSLAGLQCVRRARLAVPSHCDLPFVACGLSTLRLMRPPHTPTNPPPFLLPGSPKWRFSQIPVLSFPSYGWPPFLLNSFSPHGRPTPRLSDGWNSSAPCHFPPWCFFPHCSGPRPFPSPRSRPCPRQIKWAGRHSFPPFLNFHLLERAHRLFLYRWTISGPGYRFFPALFCVKGPTRGRLTFFFFPCGDRLREGFRVYFLLRGTASPFAG